jgi:hypothetical protein
MKDLLERIEKAHSIVEKFESPWEFEVMATVCMVEKREWNVFAEIVMYA